MPVTARLSRRFYDQFGAETVHELVDLLNAMDTTYRDDLRELNDLNFARFDAKLEQRFADQDAKFANCLTELRIEMTGRIGSLETTVERTLKEHPRWMVGGWLTVMLAVMLAVFALWVRG